MNPARPKRILIVEDEPTISEGIAEALSADGMESTPAFDGIQALELFSSEPFDLVLLDIMIPNLNGYDVCRKIREQDKRVPILILSAKTEEIDQVLGLELGADDYIAKPFRIRELIARIHTSLRRLEYMASTEKKPRSNETFHFGDAVIDRKQFTATLGEGAVDLTERELTLIELFLAHPNEALDRDFLLNRAWSIDYAGTTRTLDQHIAKLRPKVNAAGGQGCIKTVHGVGYKYIA